MQKISNFNRLKVDNLNLSVTLIKDEFNYNIVGILKRNNKILDYCETINLSDQSFVDKIYSVICDNVVFPCHFYNIIDDI